MNLFLNILLFSDIILGAIAGSIYIVSDLTPLCERLLNIGAICFLGGFILGIIILIRE